MLFNSPVFVLFFAVVFSLYWALRTRRPQNLLLLAASYVFYGTWSWKFLALLMASTLVDWSLGLLVAATSDRRRKRLVLALSVMVNLTLLGTFKYAGFFVQEAVELLGWLGFQANVRVLEIVLPVGISFYTFQSLSYVIDVYRGKLRPTTNVLDYALYVAFFPQLVAGPIERATHLLPQFQRERVWQWAAFESGLQLVVWGLFKKVVIADNLAPYVDSVFVSPAGVSGGALLTATLFFAVQIYCDFSGYSDTARGVARTLGFDLLRNFDHPYFARNPVEFWRRWHISLSQWFQDYLYFPLAMRFMRTGGWASKYKAHIISMVLIGFWHGANWTFIVFGLYWGVVIALYLYVADRLDAAEPEGPAGRLASAVSRVPAAVSMAVMFVVVCVGWVFFRAATLGDAWYVLTHLFAPGGSPVPGPAVTSLPILWTLVAGLWLVEWASRRWPRVEADLTERALPRLLLRHAMIVGILFSYFVAQKGTSQPFIYFQF
jgi:D-alanyl-lipoteichoic acid acyltransferase DltB (MBOAT superfamily)